MSNEVRNEDDLQAHTRLVLKIEKLEDKKEEFIDQSIVEFTVRVATTLEEDKELIEAGFEYVTDRDGAKIYRKRK